MVDDLRSKKSSKQNIDEWSKSQATNSSAIELEESSSRQNRRIMMCMSADMDHGLSCIDGKSAVEAGEDWKSFLDRSASVISCERDLYSK